MRKIEKTNQLPVTPWLTKGDVARILGVSMGTVNRMVCRKAIPHYKINGALVRFDLGDILAWAQQQRVSAQQERRG